jgi:xanthine dehydrogenase YagR molybdenum-binding subunit
MEMNSPVGPNALDAEGVVGKPLDRVDGRLKVTGGARYAYEMQQNTLYGFVVEASIGKGKIKSIDTRAAEKAPGVVLVLTHRNAPEQGTGNHREAHPVLTGPEVTRYGQPVAFVVAESFEQARAAAYLVDVKYDRSGGKYALRNNLDRARVPHQNDGAAADSAVGDFNGAFASAPVQLDVTYTTPLQSHAMMEPHATLAMWEGDKLILHTANQMLNQGQKVVATTLKIPVENVRLISPFIGGGFGGKLWVNADAILAAIASRQLQRPVKIALTRQQIFHATTHRSDTIQRLRLGTDRDGRILAIGHDVFSGNLPSEQTYEAAAIQTRTLYAGANRLTRHRLAPLDIPVASSMRAPGEAVGLLALECAMDELAEKLSLDPIELRLRNEPSEDPEKHIPYSSRHLIACLREGARRFGWDKRNAKPGQVRGAHYEDPPLFASELHPACGQSIRQAVGPMFALLSKYLGDQWSVGDWEGMVAAAPRALPAWIAAIFSAPAGSEPPQNLREYDPEWARAFWTGTVAASCEHARMLASVKVPVLMTHHFRRVDEASGALMGAISDLQAARVRELVTAAGQPFALESFPTMGHSLHGQNPRLFADTLTKWAAALP